MSREIFMLVDPYDANDLIFALSKSSNDYYYSIDDMLVLKVESGYFDGSDRSYVLLPNGELKKVSNIKTVIKERESIVDRVLTNMRETEDIFNSYISEKMKERDRLSGLAQDDPSYKLEYISTCVQLTSAYIIAGVRLDELKDDENANMELLDAIKQSREEEIKQEEEEKDIENELDMVNAMIKEILPYDKRKSIQIERCSYNDKEIDALEMTNKLSSHMRPEYMTQVNILDTLDDHYEIVTNTCIITRTKGGEITIKER